MELKIKKTASFNPKFAAFYISPIISGREDRASAVEMVDTMV